jgi:hypothetical protein
MASRTPPRNVAASQQSTPAERPEPASKARAEPDDAFSLAGQRHLGFSYKHEAQASELLGTDTVPPDAPPPSSSQYCSAQDLPQHRSGSMARRVGQAESGKKGLDNRDGQWPFGVGVRATECRPTTDLSGRCQRHHGVLWWAGAISTWHHGHAAQTTCRKLNS